VLPTLAFRNDGVLVTSGPNRPENWSSNYQISVISEGYGSDWMAGQRRCKVAGSRR
jgi:hypothetical protein